ncbi:hypothetical protein [Amycolatopsis sp. MEPSY49]|uniref:hypothetical protein n=1 Tax=Amycolatopsis sp. MEPSY49 TaxID=3151600 RepID=UPI003EF1670F
MTPPRSIVVAAEHAPAVALERALDLAEPGLVLPFAMTGAWRLPEALPWETRHAATILDAVRGRVPAPSVPAPLEALSPSELRLLPAGGKGTPATPSRGA